MVCLDYYYMKKKENTIQNYIIENRLHVMFFALLKIYFIVRRIDILST